MALLLEAVGRLWNSEDFELGQVENQGGEGQKAHGYFSDGD